MSHPDDEGHEQTIRAFWAIELSDAVRGAAAEVARTLRSGPGGDLVRWVRPEALHVTLRFLGDMQTARVPELLDCVARRTEPLAPFELRLGAPGAFPSPRRPRVLVLEVEPREPLSALAEAVERGVVEAGFEPEERPFRAHLTLGRVKRGARLRARIDPALAPEDARCAVEQAVLLRSQLLPSGARYTLEGRAALGAGVGAPNHPEPASPRT